MLNRIFPRQIDNGFDGHWLAIWILAIVVLARLAVTVNGTLNTAFVATSADGIPLSTYGAGAAQTVVALFSLTAISNLALCLLGIVTLIRYRAMIPLVYSLILIQSIASRIVLYVHPIAPSMAQSQPVGSFFLIGILTLTLIGFVLSLAKSTPASTGTDRV